MSQKKLPEEKLTVQHLIPRRLGVSDSLNNLSVMCHKCHALTELRKAICHPVRTIHKTIQGIIHDVVTIRSATSGK